MPAPMPRMQLMTMSHIMLRAKRHATPLRKKIDSPTARILSLSLPTESLPASRTKGMISSEGSDVSICISRSVAFGKILFRPPRIGEIASPGSEAIADTLNVMGSHRSLLEFENTRIVKDMRNRINRQINCENANLNKTVSASMRQIADIKLIEERLGLDKLPDGLRQAAQARLSNPDSSLAELAELLRLGRSGMNHRLRRLGEIASELREKENG